MNSFFSGWIGYGLSLQNLSLQEPGDTGYARRQIYFSGLENGSAFDTSGGTIGPANTAWGTLTVVGLFDTAVGGNLLVTYSIGTPVVIGAGASYTTGPGANSFKGLPGAGALQMASFPSGSVMAMTPDGRLVVVNVPVQIANGILSAQAVGFGPTIAMPSLPAQAPISGSGQLWNNGGIISVA